MTMIGASCWVGWFGFNAGSNLEATMALLGCLHQHLRRHARGGGLGPDRAARPTKPSLLGAATGAVVGLVAITPASGFAAPMTSILLGFVASAGCFFFVTTVKNRFGYDDSLDVFGVHCIGGIIGALGTGIVADPALGGQGFFDYTVSPAIPGTYVMGTQMITQLWAVGITLAWSGGSRWSCSTCSTRRSA